MLRGSKNSLMRLGDVSSICGAAAGREHPVLWPKEKGHQEDQGLQRHDAAAGRPIEIVAGVAPTREVTNPMPLESMIILPKRSVSR